MKIFSVLFLCLALNVSAQENSTKLEKPILRFKTMEIIRNEIPYDSPEQFVFEFKNKGKKPITIQNVSTSCGCTAYEKPTEPIKPGKKSKILVSYDTKRVGEFTKTITVNSDFAPPVVLTIKGKVKEQGQ
ncbi:MAG: DUF1573 domain-containing protein [Bacteroidetes bacterium]|nr:DUF1573 domain-containing protein [Bacteroidota bacterium]